MLDVIVIGGGPAALAAAVYLARQKISFAMFASELGGMALWSSDVENYLGFHLLDGVALIKRFQDHLSDYKDAFALHDQESVTALEKIDNGFRVTTDKGVHEARTILIATGEKPRHLDIPGEKAFYGKGLTYCANCDAPLFGGKNVTVVGGGNSAMDAALFLEKYASHVTLVTVNAALMGDKVMKQRCETSPKMTIIANTKTVGVKGDAFVSHIELEGADGVRQTLPTQGIFIEVGLVPSSQFLGTFVEKNKWGEVVIDKHNQTSVPGVWAAGDVTDVTEKQIAVAVGEGSKAALQIIKWLATNPA